MTLGQHSYTKRARGGYGHWCRIPTRGVGFAGAGILVGLNLLPVAFLRWREGPVGLADTPPVEQMGFVRDQHRFSTWVYAVASGNLFFWLMLSWAAFDLEHSGRTLVFVELIAFLCTFSPAWTRFIRLPRATPAAK